MKTASVLVCPVCNHNHSTGGTVCAACGADLAPLIYLSAQSTLDYNEGLRLARAGEFAEAIGPLQKAASSDPDNPQIWVVLGKVFAQLGLLEPARKALHRAQLLNPNNEEVSTSLVHLAQLEQAQSTTTATVQPKLSAGRNVRGWSLFATFLAGSLAAIAVLQIILPGLRFTQVAVVPLTTPTVSGNEGMTLPPTTLIPSTATTIATSTPIPTPLPPTTVPTAIVGIDLKETVETALRRDARFSQLVARVDGETVYIEGVVTDVRARFQAEQLVRNVPGVRFVELGGLRLARTYTVMPGDTLRLIAQQIYGSEAFWPDIARENNLSTPYIIRTGQVLILPEI